MSDINELAPKVYGPSWKGKMARYLDHWPQTIARWAKHPEEADPTAMKLLRVHVLLGWRYDRDINEVRPMAAGERLE